LNLYSIHVTAPLDPHIDCASSAKNGKCMKMKGAREPPPPPVVLGGPHSTSCITVATPSGNDGTDPLAPDGGVGRGALTKQHRLVCNVEQ